MKTIPIRVPEHFRQFVFSLPDGEAVLIIPTAIDSESYQDCEEWLTIVLRTMKRSVIATADSKADAALDKPDGEGEA